MQEKLNIAVFVDYDNIEIGLKSTLRREFDVSLALDALKEDIRKIDAARKVQDLQKEFDNALHGADNPAESKGRAGSQSDNQDTITALQDKLAKDPKMSQAERNALQQQLNQFQVVVRRGPVQGCHAIALRFVHILFSVQQIAHGSSVVLLSRIGEPNVTRGAGKQRGDKNPCE